MKKKLKKIYFMYTYNIGIQNLITNLKIITRAKDQINCLNYYNMIVQQSVDYKNTISGTIRLCCRPDNTCTKDDCVRKRSCGPL